MSEGGQYDRELDRADDEPSHGADTPELDPCDEGEERQYPAAADDAIIEAARQRYEAGIGSKVVALPVPLGRREMSAVDLAARRGTVPPFSSPLEEELFGLVMRMEDPHTAAQAFAESAKHALMAAKSKRRRCTSRWS